MASSTKSARDNDYYLDLLERKHPVVFDDFQTGKFKTVAEALKVAGVKKARTPLQEMLNGWKKATPAERDAFALNVGLAAPSVAAVVASPTASPVAIDGRLQPASIAIIQDVMAKRSMKMGDVMHELGRNRLNPSLGLALNNGSRLQQDVVDDLEVWLTKQVGTALTK